MGRVKFTATFEDGENKSVTATIEDKILAAAIIRPNSYDKTYGIDWCEMSDDLSKIEKFQETNATDISYILDEATTQFKTSATNQDKQDILYKLYETKEYLSKKTPVTWINLAKDKTAIIDITIHLKEGLDINREDYITFDHDDTKFTIEYDGKENSAIQLKRLDKARKNKKEYSEIKIKALQTLATTEYILLKTVDGTEVGKIEMASNNVLDLNVKIIPIVFNHATQKTDAQKLYAGVIKAQNTNKDNLKTTLQTRSLNQAGVNCIIEPIKEFSEKTDGTIEKGPERIVIDLTTKNWNKFYKSGILQDWDYSSTTAKPDTSKYGKDEDDNKRYHARDLGTERFLLDKLEDSYYEKYGKSFKGALIFVTDKNYILPNIQGYSQTDPIRSQGTVIFKGGLDDATVYAHELGHMLGLEHNFIKDNKDLIDTNDNLKDLTRNKSIADRKKEIENNILYMKNYMKDDLDKIEELKAKNILSEKENKELQGLQENVGGTKKSIQKEKDKLHKINIKTTTANFKVTKGKSKNFMDYTNNRTYFSKHQTEIVKQEANDFYR